MNKKKLTLEQALQKMQKYCAYQDRSHREVSEKLQEMGIWGDEAGKIIVALIEEKFLDEERFARSFVRGKFRIKQWGRLKIEMELKQKGISGYCLKAGLSEITDDVYRDTLKAVLEKKRTSLDTTDFYVQKVKLAQYAFSRGYESEIVWEVVNELLVD
jgi:regulatory protein